MTTLVAAQVYRDYETDGVPSSGAHVVLKSDVRAWGTAIEGAALAYKAPCLCATTANITLSGLQTIDGYTTFAGDRVLVWKQTDQTTNGIYAAASGAWSRAVDASASSMWATGTQVKIERGTVAAGLAFALTCTDNPIALGTSLMTFSSALIITGLTVTPPQGISQALNTLQIVTGAISAPLNNFHISFDQGTAGSGFSEGWYFQHEFGGGATTGGRQGLTIQLSQNAATNAANANRQYVAFAPFVTANSGDGGGSGTELGFYYAIGSFTWIKAAATHIVQAQCGEFDMLVESGASVLEKYGLKVVQVAADAVQGANNDAAFIALRQAGGVAPGWKVLIQGGDGVSGQQPLASTGTVLAFKSAQTVDGGIDLRTNVTCSTFAFQSNNFRVDGAGVITGASLKSGSNQVVGARITGYTAMTGSPDKATSYATGSVTTAQLAGRVAQIQADLTTHGLIGP